MGTMMCGKSVFIILYMYIVYNFINCSCYKTSIPVKRNNYYESKAHAGLCAHVSCNCTNFLPGTAAQWITINCNFSKNEIVNIINTLIPNKTKEVILIDGNRIDLSKESFSHIAGLEKVILQGFNDVLISKHAFLNSTANHVKVDVIKCNLVTIETEAFKNSQGPSINISQCDKVILQGNMFSNLNDMTVADVGLLELSENAFKLDTTSTRRHGYHTKITFQKLKAQNFPKKVFGSSVSEIHLHEVTVRDVQGDAFSAIAYNTVIAINSSFTKIYKEAFPQPTIIKKLEILNCTISSLASDAILSATENLTIKNSKLKEVATGAIRMTAAKVTIGDNEFKIIHTKGLEFEQWSQITIEGNVFENLETNPIMCYTNDINMHNNNSFTFIKNGIFKLKEGSLKFISDVKEVLPIIKYEKTYFDVECGCKIEQWLQKVFNKNSSHLHYVYDSSYCTVNENTLIDCYHQKNMLIRNFTLEVCTNETNIKCPMLNKNVNKNNNDVQNSKYLNRKNQLREEEEAKILNKRIVHIILIVASVGIILIVIFVVIRRTNFCSPIVNPSVSSNNCCVRIFDRMCNGHYGLDSARSISRLSIQEYNESHRLDETRILDINGSNNEEEQLISEDVPMFDKATQTLPEELTKELLESLREKLDDPDNYSEAREMIEHLYDLIKVEESCNSNNNIVGGLGNQDYIDDQHNLYDVIQLPVVNKKGKNDKIMVDVGTRVPSLEKLTQFSPYMRPTALCHEYFEPRDQTWHLYAELPNDRNSDLQHIPDVVSERSSRPLSFLRAIGEKIQPYQSTTIPGGTVRSIDSATRMANRPLPEKPKDPGEGTSSQRH